MSVIQKRTPWQANRSYPGIGVMIVESPLERGQGLRRDDAEMMFGRGDAKEPWKPIRRI